MAVTELASIVGDSQAEGLKPVLGPILARHGLELDDGKSWTRAGAGVVEITEHAVRAGPVRLTIAVTGGGNDTIGNIETYREKLVALVGTLRFAGAQEVILVGPMLSDDPEVQARHEAARAVQSRGIPGARWVDGFALSAFVGHPAGNPNHYSRNGYQAIGLELERAIFDSGTRTAIGLVGTLGFLGAAGVVLMEALYARAEG